jgi:hypothetical protein
LRKSYLKWQKKVISKFEKRYDFTFLKGEQVQAVKKKPAAAKTSSKLVMVPVADIDAQIYTQLKTQNPNQFVTNIERDFEDLNYLLSLGDNNLLARNASDATTRPSMGTNFISMVRRFSKSAFSSRTLTTPTSHTQPPTNFLPEQNGIDNFLYEIDFDAYNEELKPPSYSVDFRQQNDNFSVKRINESLV